MAERTLPPLPVDDTALDLYVNATRPAPGAVRSSLTYVLRLYSQLAESDVDTATHDPDGPWDAEGVDPTYHVNDLVAVLIEEIRRLRAAEQETL